MEDNISPQEEYVSISGFSVPAKYKNYFESGAFLEEFKGRYPQGAVLTEKMIEQSIGTYALNIAMKDPEFVLSLERALKDVEEGNVEELPDDFFD